MKSCVCKESKRSEDGGRARGLFDLAVVDTKVLRAKIADLVSRGACGLENWRREQKQQPNTHTQQQLFLFILASPPTFSLRHEKSDSQPTSHETRLSLPSLKLQKEGKARIERKM